MIKKSITKTMKLQFWCNPFGQDYMRLPTLGWHIFELGIIKIHKYPEDGQSIGKPEHYKGFIIKFAWWFPIDKAY